MPEDVETTSPVEVLLCLKTALLTEAFYLCLNKGEIGMKNKFLSLLAAALLLTGLQATVMAAPCPTVPTTAPGLVLLDAEDVVLVTDEPAESGDVLVDEDGDEWVVQ